jgi:hypothetical protein
MKWCELSIQLKKQQTAYQIFAKNIYLCVLTYIRTIL